MELKIIIEVKLKLKFKMKMKLKVYTGFLREDLRYISNK
jgi:hypothetical protein